MHFDSAKLLVIESVVPETIAPDICSKATIDSGEQVQIKRGSHTERIIVGLFQASPFFFQIYADKQAATAGAKRRKFSEKMPGLVVKELWRDAFRGLS